MKAHVSFRFAIVSLMASASLMAPLGAESGEAEEDAGWKHVSELSFVATAGNAETTTFGFQHTAERQWARNLLTLEAAGLRSETDDNDRVAIGTPDDFRLVDVSDSELTAENYLLRSRFQQDISERVFWFGAAGWERNEFAGIENRYSLVGGIGHTWFESEAHHFRTDYAVTGTRQEDVEPGPDGTEDFFGLRFSWDYLRRLSDTTTYENTLAIDQNLDETDDLRAEMIQALSVSISERLALRLSLELDFDNQPALEALELLGEDGAPSGQTVRVEVDDLDAILKTALVVNF